jgi:hypothetical protein
MIEPIVNGILKSVGPSDKLKDKLRPIFGYILFAIVFIIILVNTVANFKKYGKPIAGKSLYD